MKTRYASPLLFGALFWTPGLRLVAAAQIEQATPALLVLLGLLMGYLGCRLVSQWQTRRHLVSSRFNPYIAGSPIRSREMFFGRQQLLRNIEAGLAYNSMMLHGERRIGKTSLLYQLLADTRRMRDDKFRFFPIFVDLEGTPETLFFHHLMEGLLDALQKPLHAFPAQEKLQYYLFSDEVSYTDRHLRRDLREIIAYLKKNSSKTPRLLFLLDEADVMSTYSSLSQQQFRRILQDTFAHNIGTVISGVHISKAWDRTESPWYNMFVEVVIEPFGRKEAEMLMRGPVRGVYEWEEDAITFVWRRSAGRPHRIQQIAREAVNFMLDDHRKRITLADVHKGYDRIVFAESH